MLDSRLRGNDTLQPASPQPASPAGGEAGCVIRLVTQDIRKYPFALGSLGRR